MSFILLSSCILLSGISATLFPQKEFITLQPLSPGAGVNFISGGAVGSGFNDIGGDFSGDKTGAVLGSLALSSAVQAKNAAHVQQLAGSQAEYGVKSTLASVAAGAAKTAQAALIGKQAIVSNIKYQLVEAQHKLQEEIAQYRQTQASTHAAQETSYQAQEQLNNMNKALVTAQANAQNAGNAAAEAAQSEASQKAMVIDAKQRLALLISQLKHSYGDLKDTEVSVQKAASAAHVAQSNAASSASRAAHGEYGKYYF